MFNMITGEQTPDAGTYQAMGLPTDPMATFIPPGFSSTSAAVQNAPAITSAQDLTPEGTTVWDTIKQDAHSFINIAEHPIDSAQNGIKAIYNTGKSAISTVVSDVEAPIATLSQNLFLYAIVGIIVLAGAIYFIGKGGAVKVHAVV